MVVWMYLHSVDSLVWERAEAVEESLFEMVNPGLDAALVQLETNMVQKEHENRSPLDPYTPRMLANL